MQVSKRYVAGVPDGKDPDEFVRHRGKEAFAQVIASAVEGIEFQIEETILQINVTNLAGKSGCCVEYHTIPFRMYK